MALLSKTDIATNNTIQAEHITRIIDALNGTGSADVIATGSFTGSFVGDGSGLTGVSGGSTSGIWGISDSSGSYTYYTTISASNAAATAGDTIELFANVTETSAVSWVLKPNVTYQLNGYTYTLDEPTGTNVLDGSSITATDEVHIMNGTIKRTGGSSGNFDHMILYSNSLGRFYFHNTIFENDSNTLIRAGVGIYDGGVWISLNNGVPSTGVGAVYTTGNAKVNNAKIYTKAHMGIRAFGGTFTNCFAYSESTRAIQLSNSSAIAINCIGYSDGGNGMAIQNASAKALNCTAISTSTTAMDVSGIVENCYAYSSAGVAMYGLNANARIKGSVMRSATTNGLNIANASGVAENCTIISEGSQAVSMTGTMLNCSVEGPNLTYGDCVTANDGSIIGGCSLRVTNASAECLAAGSAVNVYYANNLFAGNPTLAVNANISQAQPLTSDAHGNIEIG